MFGIDPVVFGFMDPVFRQHVINDHKQRVREALKGARDWDPEHTRWEKFLALRAISYHVRDLFPEVKRNTLAPSKGLQNPETYIESPQGAFRYMVNIIPEAGELETVYAGRAGHVAFDGPVETPALYERGVNGLFTSKPWMSLTPMEIMTMRPGTRRAHGRVIIAGLGLGHQLIEVSQRRRVKEITLVEISRELVDWLWPRIAKFLGPVPVQLVVGDAAEVIPNIAHADVALIDTFKGYGGNYVKYPVPADFVWCWGAPEMKGDGGW